MNELSLGAVFKRDDFLYGIMVNARGERFVDEGADIRALTYAKMGRAILAQPGQVAWQIFDNKASHLLHDEYRAPQAARRRGDTLAELASRLDGIDRNALLATVECFNRAWSGRINIDSMLDMQDWFARNKFTSARFAADRLVDPSYAEYAAQKLGPFVLENKDSKLAGCR